jgi:hypothetical protein
MSKTKEFLTAEQARFALEVFAVQMTRAKQVNIKHAIKLIFGTQREGGSAHRLVSELADAKGYPRRKKFAWVTPARVASFESYCTVIDVMPDWVTRCGR